MSFIPSSFLLNNVSAIGVIECMGLLLHTSRQLAFLTSGAVVAPKVSFHAIITALKHVLDSVQKLGDP
jgi:hypothetical protein